MDQYPAQHHVPKNPEYKRTFLPFPKAGDHVMKGKRSGGVRKSIKIFKPEIVYDIKQCNGNGNTGNSMNIKGYPAESLPGGLIQFRSYGIFIIRKSRYNGANKS